MPTAIHSGLHGNAAAARRTIFSLENRFRSSPMFSKISIQGAALSTWIATRPPFEGAVSSGFILAADQEEIMAVADVEWPGLS